MFHRKNLWAGSKLQHRFSEQSEESIFQTIRSEVLEGAYPLIHYQGFEDYCPGDNVVHLFAMGALGVEAIRASDRLRVKRHLRQCFHCNEPRSASWQSWLPQRVPAPERYVGDYRKPSISGLPMKWHPLRSGIAFKAAEFPSSPFMMVNRDSSITLEPLSAFNRRPWPVRKTSKSGTTAEEFHFQGIDADGVESAAQRGTEEDHKRGNPRYRGAIGICRKEPIYTTGIDPIDAGYDALYRHSNKASPKMFGSLSIWEILLRVGAILILFRTKTFARGWQRNMGKGIRDFKKSA